MQIFQNNKRVPWMDNFQNISILNALHMSESNNNIPSDSCELKFAKATENEYFWQTPVQIIFSVWKWSIAGLLSKYACIFYKDKCDVGCVNKEP